MGAAQPAPRYARQAARRPSRQAGGTSAPHCLSRHRNTDRLPQRYRLPVYVLENGTAYADKLDEKSSVADRPRIEFLRAYTDAMFAATDAGADIRGYFVWSLLDNFEWGSRYSQRFGFADVERYPAANPESILSLVLAAYQKRPYRRRRREYGAFLGLTGPSGRLEYADTHGGPERMPHWMVVLAFKAQC
jgi:Glycosyl hydrolase family 1